MTGSLWGISWSCAIPPPFCLDDRSLVTPAHLRLSEKESVRSCAVNTQAKIARRGRVAHSKPSHRRCTKLSFPHEISSSSIILPPVKQGLELLTPQHPDLFPSSSNMAWVLSACSASFHSPRI